MESPPFGRVWQNRVNAPRFLEWQQASGCSSRYDWLGKRVPLRQQAQFLRERARRLREIADAERTPLSERLREIAADLETRADELERSNPP
jgi:hypothetical protein